MSRITAPWWTFVGMSLFFILVATGSLYLSIVAFHFLFG